MAPRARLGPIDPLLGTTAIHSPILLVILPQNFHDWLPIFEIQEVVDCYFCPFSDLFAQLPGAAVALWGRVQ